jgi:hypothetical protein
VDTGFLAAVAIALCFLTGMVVVRLGAAGESSRRIAVLVAELWLAVVLWIVIFWSLAAATGIPEGTGGVEHVRELGARLAALPSTTRLLTIAGVVASIALVAHLMWSVRRLGSLGPGR